MKKGPGLGQVFKVTWKQLSIRSEKPDRDVDGRESLKPSENSELVRKPIKQEIDVKHEYSMFCQKILRLAFKSTQTKINNI